jgi:hypothetical protein
LRNGRIGVLGHLLEPFEGFSSVNIETFHQLAAGRRCHYPSSRLHHELNYSEYEVYASHPEGLHREKSGHTTAERRAQLLQI